MTRRETPHLTTTKLEILVENTSGERGNQSCAQKLVFSSFGAKRSGDKKKWEKGPHLAGGRRTIPDLSLVKYAHEVRFDELHKRCWHLLLSEVNRRK